MARPKPSLAHALLRPRHVAATALVTLVLAGVGLGMVAASQPAPLPAEPVEAPFMLPRPAIGDHGRYVLQTPSDEYWPSEIEFEWLPDAEGFDGTGARITVNRLLVAMKGWFVDDAGKPYADWSNETIDFVAGTHQRAARRWADGLQQTAPSWLPGTSESVHDTRWESWSFGTTRPEMPWCGILNELQGKPVGLGAPFPLGIPCPNGPGSWNVDGFVANATGVDGVAPHRAVQAMHWMVDAGREPWPYQNVTYHEEVAYPVRLEFLVGPRAVYVLEAFQAGAVPLAAGAAPLAPPPPGVTLAPRQVWGPDETGIEHPFPASAAFALARDDPAFPDLRAFLARHPDAYVGTAGYQEMGLNHEVSRAWVMVVTDGTGTFPFMVEVRDLAGAPEGMPHLRAMYRTDVTWGKDTLYLAPSQAPREVPTVASLMATWSHLDRTPAGLANDWGWDIGLHCGSDGDCRPNGYAFMAGRTQDKATGVPAMPVVGLNRTIFESFVSLNATGALNSYQRIAMHSFERFSALGAASAPQGQAPGAGFTPIAAYQRPQLGWLATPEAAAAGALALLAGALYWLWPALKAGPALLFSRVKDEDVLKHPLRAEVHQRIEADPGIHHQALIRAVGRGNGAVEHHLAKLIAAGLVSRVQGKGFTCYFAKGTVDYRDMAAAPLLKSPVARSIVELVRRQPGVRSAELARALGVAPATIHYHVDRLRQANVLHGSLEGGALRLHAAEQAGTAAAA
jgi:hypothetical protein